MAAVTGSLLQHQGSQGPAAHTLLGPQLSHVPLLLLRGVRRPHVRQADSAPGGQGRQSAGPHGQRAHGPGRATTPRQQSNHSASERGCGFSPSVQRLPTEEGGKPSHLQTVQNQKIPNTRCRRVVTHVSSAFRPRPAPHSRKQTPGKQILASSSAAPAGLKALQPQWGG